jgi:hypothetical protein
MNSRSLLLKIFSGILFVAMVTVNFLASSLPINNRSTGEISDAYPNLFTPAGITFSIWGIIYLLLAGFVIYQFIAFGKKTDQKKQNLLQKINLLFLASSVANISWILAWHYDFIGLSVAIMLILLILLIRLADLTRPAAFSKSERIWITLPFSVYFGWITVATIANITVLMVSLNWEGFGLADSVWTIVILLVGALIGILRMQKDQKVAYGFVLVWAYLGILLSHTSDTGFDSKYPVIIITLIVCLVLFAGSITRVLIMNQKRK